MTSQRQVTTASLKQAHKEDNRGIFICLYLKHFCAFILETSQSKLRDPKQYIVKV